MASRLCESQERAAEWSALHIQIMELTELCREAREAGDWGAVAGALYARADVERDLRDWWEARYDGGPQVAMWSFHVALDVECARWATHRRASRVAELE